MRLSAIGFMLTLTLGILTALLAAEAQQATKVHRIGRLSAGPPLPEPNPSLEAFRQGLHDLGYVEGQNLVIEHRYAEGSQERLRDLAAELVQLKVDVIVAVATLATRAAQHVTRTIPIVMAGSADPVGLGLVASLARPGGNITGVSYLQAELPGKRLELLKETVPQSTCIAVLANWAAPTYDLYMHNLTVAARALGLPLHVIELRRADELDSAFAAMTHAGADALVVLTDGGLLDSLHGRIAALATTSRLPTMYGWKSYAEAGGLMSYGPSQRENGRLVAAYVDKILKGTKPADLPVEQPTKFELVLNLKTAQALGFTFPPGILFQADEVIR
jgi:putative tryptophan/tyrosine transport system substrate-binding protein